jgi:hypothetical protein
VSQSPPVVLRIPLGQALVQGRLEPLVWDSSAIVNGHVLLVGASGTGKTFRLRHFMDAAMRQNPRVRFHVIDVHGDLRIPGAEVVEFSESKDYGLNPLAISADPDFGGVRKRIRAFISTLNRTSRRLGTKQEAVLANLLSDLYHSRGFRPEAPGTWRESPDRKMPTLGDLCRFTRFKLEGMIIGAGSKATVRLEAVNREAAKLGKAWVEAKREERGAGKGATREEGQAALEKAKAAAKEAYAEYIDAIETGREIGDLIKYNSRDVIQSVYERLSTLESSGVFKPNRPPFTEGSSVRVYGLKALSADEQRIFVDILLEDLFFEARRRGERPSTETFIVIDEAHKFVSEEDDHILNVIVKEARKFGVGLVLASQSLTHFPDDVVANTATKIILGIDEMFHEAMARKIRIDPKQIGGIKPHRTALVQVKVKGDLSNRFVPVVLPKT